MAESAPTREIRIVPVGQTGNRMLQYMLAVVIQDRVPDARIVGAELPEWGIQQPATEPPAGRICKLVGHDIPLEKTIKKFGRSKYDTILLRSPSSQVSFYQHKLRQFRTLFKMPRFKRADFAETLVIHARLNKLSLYGRGPLVGVHPDYPVLPIAWYEELVAKSGLKPLFVGEFSQDPYTQELKRRFPAAEFIRNSDPMEDFRLMYSAENIAISSSTFSWLAAWLSPYSKSIVMPIVGFFNPQQRPDVNMLPVQDERFSFYEFPVIKWLCSPEQLEEAMHGPVNFSPIRPADVAAKYARQDTTETVGDLVS